jgi:hypothetical protein
MYKGKEPATGALVVFHPASSGDATNPLRPTATVGEDGSFVLSTYKPEDGAPAGDYSVTIVWLEKPAKSLTGTENRSLAIDRLKGRYADAKAAKLKAHIEKGQTNEVRFDVD